MNVLEMRGICKYFGSFCANYDVNFDLRQGEIHAILGENGAGKSTLMNSLYGLHSYDAGTVTLHGKEVRFKGPGDAIAHGIGMVHQHFALIPQLTVTDNVFLGLKEAGFLMDRKKLDAQVQALNDEYRFNVDPKACIWQLPVGVQQKVEILKLLMRKAKILILDEPTAVLTPQEVTELFESLKTLTAAGCSVILITHKIEDVIRYCDRVTVLRDGKVAGNVNTADTNKDELANMMVGRDVFLDRKSTPHPFGDVLFRAENICADNNKGLRAVKNVSFEIRAGEILGIAGVDGNGQLELGEALTGLRRHTGSVSFADGEKLTKASPREMIEKGLGHIPDDRHNKGLVLQMSVKDNLLLASQRKKTYA
ncbi:MAG: ATP-binding cassette domain-containing protein, partial [Oscillospiraceae bacterium]|nr:ATP-binding cassette domain-containing protein [Oscillospiraceae bacterium]